ncbi:hypothetical protein [Shimia sp. MIT1388]|uniref:hypothetical protein n=1 Tax=Shimia sp. MIT1388 TaxID=3096992 RepID=UPI00399A7252
MSLYLVAKMTGAVMQIGIRVYQVQVFHNHALQKITSDGGPNDLLEFTQQFSARCSKAALDDGESRMVRYEPEPNFKNSAHGWMRYGKYGYGSQVEDVNTGKIALNRGTSQADTIPLYYRYWFAEGKKYGLLALQSFGGLSCVEVVNRAFTNTHALAFPDHRVTFSKVMPNDAKLYGNRDVRQIHLVKKDADQSVIEKALRPENKSHKVDVELSIKARAGGTFGKLKDLDTKMGGHLEVGDIDYEGVFAEVKVGSSYKRIGVLGVSSSAGVIDITDEVTRDADRHPELKSIQKSVSNHISDFSKVLG